MPQGQGGASFQPTDILKYFEELKRRANVEIGPIDIFEIASTNRSTIMTNEFGLIGLRSELVQTLIEKGYNAPTPIQSELIPVLLAGRDVIGQSQTGSGKTAAFGLPILQALQAGQRHVQSLIMAPTRELAIQVAEAMSHYGRQVQRQGLSRVRRATLQPSDQSPQKRRRCGGGHPRASA